MSNEKQNGLADLVPIGGRGLDKRSAKIIRRGLKSLTVRRYHTEEIACFGEGAVLAAATSPDSQVCAVSTLKGIFLHDEDSLARIGFLKTESVATSIAISPNNQQVAFGVTDGKVYLWEVSSVNQPWLLTGHTEEVSKVSFSPDGQLLATGSHDKSVIIWDIKTKQRVYTLQGHENRVIGIVFSPDSCLLASWAHDSEPKVWDVRLGRLFRDLKQHIHRWIYGMAFSPDSQQVVSVGDFFYVTDLNTGNLLNRAMLPWDDGPSWVHETHRGSTEVDELIRKLPGYTSVVNSISFSPDGSLIASCGKEPRVRLWDVSNGSQIKTYEVHSESYFPVSFNNVAFSPDGKLLASSPSVSPVYIWNVDTGVAVHQLEVYSTSIAFSPDGSLLAIGGRDGKLLLLQFASGAILWERNAHTQKYRSKVFSVAFAPDGKFIASGGEDGTVKLWNAANGNQIRNFYQSSYHKPSVQSVSFMPDGKGLVVREEMGLAFYDLETGKRELINDPNRNAALYASVLERLERYTELNKEYFAAMSHSNTTSGLSSDGSVWAIGCNTGEIQLWDMTYRKIVDKLVGHYGKVVCTTFSPDGLLLASGGEDGTIRLWGVKQSQ